MIGRPLALSLLVLAAPAVHAAVDRKAPTTPTNLRVTGVTAYTVSFAWGASSDNSGSFSYRLVNRTLGGSVVVPGNQTSFTWAASNFNPSQTLSFHIFAFDAAGNASKQSNIVSASLLRDTTAPLAPQLTLSDNGPTHLSLSWTIQDDDPTPQYVVTMNGSVIRSQGSEPSFVVALLAPESTHSFTVQAKDSGGNWSPVSAALTATTEASDPNDHTPPTVPPGFWGGAIGNCEVMLHWNDSADDVTAAQFIRYDISINGTHIDSTSLGYTDVIEYGIVDGPNRFEVVAIDEAGNRSAPVSATFDLFGCVVLGAMDPPDGEPIVMGTPHDTPIRMGPARQR